jgi:histidinol-phosphate aminotransferase
VKNRVHGGPVVAELESLGLRAEEVLDLSVSTNPYGPSPAMAAAIRGTSVADYPDPACTRARRTLGEHLGVGPERLSLGNGAADLLWALARTLLGPGRTVLVVEPTFGELRAAAAATGARIEEWRASPDDDFALHVDAIAERARECQADVVSLCAPNVPTGAALPAREIADLAIALPHLQVIVDQSFLLLSERHADLGTPLPENVVCVRSLTKEHRIPGVRVGYLLASEEVLTAVERHRPAWSASAPAQAAAIASCDAADFVTASRERLLAARADLTRDLAAWGPVPSTANYFLLETGRSATVRRRLLAEHRILVRDCASFGLPEHVRVAVWPGAERLATALRSL